MIKVERLAERMRAKGLSQAELARRVGISQQAIGKLVNGSSRSTPHIGQIATILETSPAYLVGQSDDPAEGAPLLATPEVIADQLELVRINEVSLDYGMGGSYLDDAVELIPRYFPEVWLRSVTDTPPEALFFARGRGDSMQPTLLDGDMVLIDRSERMIREQDRIWAIAYGDIGSIKRLRRTPRGEVKVMSDNPTVSEEVIGSDDLYVIGRVVWIGRKI
ncbi:MAG: hypothetical protein JWN59_1765 [Sphingomonas bacterium]|jgi:phage repressor protein C with HTH and peptisase S24 domain|nr:hypothetical protein [Sphingomonas bacterium]MDB5683564.1 hypothetical protein [Sphingomonas bacterium]